jgi:vacuolar-type H+-ATPase subunit F/Vma7
MGRIAVLGEASHVAYYRLSGALVMVAESPKEILSAWNALPSDVDVVVVTAAAAAELAKHPKPERIASLRVTLP